MLRSWLPCIQGCMGGNIGREIDVRERTPQPPRLLRRSSQERRNCRRPFATQTFQSMLAFSTSRRHDILHGYRPSPPPGSQAQCLQGDRCTQGPLGMR